MSVRHGLEISTHAPSPTSSQPQQAGLNDNARSGSIARASVSGAAICIATAGIVAYLTSFSGAFNFDDRYILNNESIRRLWPPWSLMLAPENLSRPLVGLSLALNYAISGVNVWSYHAFNLAVHILAALALFGIVRRTLSDEPLRVKFGSHSYSLALVVSLIWLVHPLQTQSVTYVIQRSESMMGLFYLATLYCSIRSFEAGGAGSWRIGAVAACAAGMVCKPVMVTAPITVLLYDVLLRSGSFKAALKRRASLYFGLAATWMLLAATIIASPRSETAGLGIATITPFEYFRSQFGVVVHYLRLSLWPHPLVIDYAWPKATTAREIAPHSIIVGVLVAGTLWSFIRRKPVAFLGLWFFLILALTSSFLPIADLAFEHRMYLSLAAVIALIVLTGYRLWNRVLKAHLRLRRNVALAAVTLTVVSLIFVTLRRNQDYQSEVALWTDVVTKRPQNARAHNNLGLLLAERGELEAALRHFMEACNHNPYYPEAQNNLGLSLCSTGDFEQGKAHLLAALQLNPHYSDAHYNLGRAAAAQDQLAEAAWHLMEAVRLEPAHAEAMFNLGLVHEKRREIDEAISCFQSAVDLRPNWAGALSHLALVLATTESPRLRNPVEAMRLAERAVDLTGGAHPVPLEALAASYAGMGQFAEAAQTTQKAINLASTSQDQDRVSSLIEKLNAYRTGHNPRSDIPNLPRSSSSPR